MGSHVLFIIFIITSVLMVVSLAIFVSSVTSPRRLGRFGMLARHGQPRDPRMKLRGRFAKRDAHPPAGRGAPSWAESPVAWPAAPRPVNAPGVGAASNSVWPDPRDPNWPNLPARRDKPDDDRTGPSQHAQPGQAVVTPPKHLSAFDPQRPRVRFADVAGIGYAIDELREVADYLAYPARFHAVGALMPHGILLCGPPGCGKTLLAKALAGETGVPFYSVSASSFVEQFVGIGASRVRHLFNAAKKHPASIIFIDELDAIGRARNAREGGDAEFDHTLNQLLVELDGFEGATGVLLLGATNRPELLDSALLRPGRFDRRIRIELPDKDGREAILQLHASTRPFSSRVEWTKVAAHTAGLAPADLANIVNEAALLAARKHQSMIGPPDVEEALNRQLAGGPSSSVISDADRWALAVHEAGHALLSQLMKYVQSPPRVSIMARGSDENSIWCPTESAEVLTKRKLVARLMLLLGGRAAEISVFGEPSTQSEDDLAHAARMARHMVERWAMTGRYELAGAEKNDKKSTPYFEGSAGGAEVRRLLAGAERAARVILADNRRMLVQLAEVLADRETLSSDEVAAVVAKGPGPRRVGGNPPTPLFDGLSTERPAATQRAGGLRG
ncbi:MAG: AAA family ATPase [Acidimicrobiales bacterium]